MSRAASRFGCDRAPTSAARRPRALVLAALAWLPGLLALATPAPGWSQPTAPRPADPRAAAGYPAWQFRPTPPTNARALPPDQEAVPYVNGYGAPPGSLPGQPLGQPPGQPPAGWPGQAGYPPQYPNPYPGQPPGQPPARYPGQYPGQYSSQYPGQYPGQYPNQPPGQYPGQYGWPSQPGGASQAPRVEVELTEPRPYVQQNVLVRLRVVSPTSLATASPDLSGHPDVLIEQVGDPTASSRRGEAGDEVVTEYVLVVTPLRTGDIAVGPLTVSGTLVGGVPFKASAARPLELSVQPPMGVVQPWLPLRSLDIALDIDADTVLAEGRPIPLVLTMTAGGGLGSQLPSLAGALRSEDFRVYREQSRTVTRLSDDGRRLIGTRTEYFTLVPHSGGRLQLPELRVAWWNIDADRRESSGVPIRTLNVAGEAGRFGFGRGAERATSGGWAWIWMPLAAVALLLTGYWGGVWLRGQGAFGRRRAGPDDRPDAASVRAGLRATATAWLADLRARLDPRPATARIANAAGALARRTLVALTPPSTRVLRCAIAAERADSPAAWALAFQTRACTALRSNHREPLPRVADRIVALRPGADHARVRALIAQLDTALYNGQPLDFPRWKRDFRQALRPGLGGLRGLFAQRVRRNRLPALNPSMG